MAIRILARRRLLNAVTHEGIDARLQALTSAGQGKEPVSVYLGFDPTADSLHVGNLCGLMALKAFQQAGIRPIALIGGATGCIGDPSGKDHERQMLSLEQIEENIVGIHRSLEKVLSVTEGEHAPLVVNNMEWYREMNVIEFLRQVGKEFRVGTMISRDSVKSRLANDGMSFTEFSYQLLQGYDFKYLHEKFNCQVQLGGSDQWGNIVGGCELIRRTLDVEAYGVTFPLLTTSSGEKLGKSAGNAIWLNADKTSPYALYQHFLNTADEDVEGLLYQLTTIPEDAIAETMARHTGEPHHRIAQGRLAEEVTEALHGQASLGRAKLATEILFGDSEQSFVDVAEGIHALTETGSVPEFELPATELSSQSVADLFVKFKICQSKGECRRLVSSGGLYVNMSRVTDANAMLDTVKHQTGANNFILVRKGQKIFLHGATTLASMTLLSQLKNEYPGTWTPQCAEALQHALATLSSKVQSRSTSLTHRIDHLSATTAQLHVHLENTVNAFDALANHQFIESRVYEDDDTARTDRATGPKEPVQNSAQLKQSSAILHGTAALALFAQSGEAPADQYNQRPLPCLIGSHEYYSDPGLGIALRVAQPVDVENGDGLVDDEASVDGQGLFDSEEEEMGIGPLGHERLREKSSGEGEGGREEELKRNDAVKVQARLDMGIPGFGVVKGSGGLFDSDEEIMPLREGVGGHGIDRMDRMDDGEGERERVEEPGKQKQKKKAFSGLFDSSDESDAFEEDPVALMGAEEKGELKDVRAPTAARRVKGSLFSDSDSESGDSGLFPSSSVKQRDVQVSSPGQPGKLKPAEVPGPKPFPSELDETVEKRPNEAEESSKERGAAYVKGTGVSKSAFLSELNAALGQGRPPVGLLKEEVGNVASSKEETKRDRVQESISNTNEVLLSRPTIPSRRKRPKGRKKVSFTPTAPRPKSVITRETDNVPQVKPAARVKKSSGLFDDSSNDDVERQPEGREILPEVKADTKSDPRPDPELGPSGLFYDSSSDDCKQQPKLKEIVSEVKPDPKPDLKSDPKPKKTSKGLFDDSSDDETESDLFSSARQSTFKASSLAKTSLFGDSDSDSGLFD